MKTESKTTPNLDDKYVADIQQPIDSKQITTKTTREKALERLRKRQQRWAQIGLLLQRGTILDPRSWTWM